MGLGVLDIILALSFKSALRLFYYSKSSAWKRTTAFVTDQIVLKPIWGCPSVKLDYRFDSIGYSTKGWDVIPFPGVPQAESYARSFSHNSRVIIRVNPKNPLQTRYFDVDQKGRFQSGR